MSGYTPKYLGLHELFPPEMYKKYINSPQILWRLLDDRMLWTADHLRIRFGPVTVNTWMVGGSSTLRGFRPWDTDVGAALSQHKFGRALDCTFKNATAEEIRMDILTKGHEPAYLHISCIEEGVSWLHFDVRNYDTQLNGILVVHP